MSSQQTDTDAEIPRKTTQTDRDVVYASSRITENALGPSAKVCYHTDPACPHLPDDHETLNEQWPHHNHYVNITECSWCSGDATAQLQRLREVLS